MIWHVRLFHSKQQKQQTTKKKKTIKQVIKVVLNEILIKKNKRKIDNFYKYKGKTKNKKTVAWDKRHLLYMKTMRGNKMNGVEENNILCIESSSHIYFIIMSLHPNIYITLANTYMWRETIVFQKNVKCLTDVWKIDNFLSHLLCLCFFVGVFFFCNFNLKQHVWHLLSMLKDV